VVSTLKYFLALM